MNLDNSKVWSSRDLARCRNTISTGIILEVYIRGLVSMIKICTSVDTKDTKLSPLIHDTDDIYIIYIYIYKFYFKNQIGSVFSNRFLVKTRTE